MGCVPSRAPKHRFLFSPPPTDMHPHPHPTLGASFTHTPHTTV